MNIQNVYEYLSNTKYDPHLIRNNSFILYPHQVIPKYYLLSNPDVYKLIISFSMGAGKSALAVFTLLYNLEIYRMYNFNKQFATSSSKFFKTHSVNQNVIVVGAWQTKSQFELELMRPEFSIIDESKTKEIENLLRSNIEEQREEGKLKRKKIINQIDKDIKFQGYQSFFNSVFPEVSAESYNQNINSLIQEYDRGNLKINPKFLESARDNIIIIDEMQRLYSTLGLNTFGFAIACIGKVARQYNIKMLFLTGTMINSSLGEVSDILNIISDNSQFFERKDFCDETTILGNITIWRIRQKEKENIMKMFAPNFMYYNQSKGVKSEPPQLASITTSESSLKGSNINNSFNDVFNQSSDELEYLTNEEDNNIADNVASTTGGNKTLNLDDVFIPETARKLPKSKLFMFAKRKNLPQEIHIGNRIISDANSLQPMIVYAVETHGLQTKRFIEYVRNNFSAFNNLNEDLESDVTTSIHDAFIPPSTTWNQHGIYESNNLLWGRFLELKNLINYSCLGVEFCKLCLENAFANEKTIVYHSKINSFGIKQYGAILQYNGFIRYGSAPSQTSLCKFCRHTYADHTKLIEERIKMKCCNKFRGIYYDMLTGDLDQNERDAKTNNIFNNPNNLYGDLINVMFVSDVAYSGVSFLNTQNMIILTRIPNISKWKQIYARIIRTRSHALLPENKQYAKIYTMIVETPDETKTFKELNGLTFEERYYKIRSILNEDIDGFINELSTRCIGNVLLNSPSQYTPSKLEQSRCTELFQTDLSNEIRLIVNRIMNHDNCKIWSLQSLLERIKDSSKSVSYLNVSIVPNEMLINMMLKNKLITLFQYKINNDQTIYAQFHESLNSPLTSSNINVATFDFGILESINVQKNNMNSLLKLLETETAITNIIILLGKILKLTNHRYELLIGRKIFWDTMYNIGNEYYEDDEVNFIHNHCRKYRNKANMVGCYYGQRIIYKTGKYKFIDYSFPIVGILASIPYKFKISCLAFTESSPFYLHVSIIKVISNNTSDKRKEAKGLVCTSMNINELHKYFPKIDPTLHKKKYCNELLFSVCELQEENKDIKFCYTPFEK